MRGSVPRNCENQVMYPIFSLRSRDRINTANDSDIIISVKWEIVNKKAAVYMDNRKKLVYNDIYNRAICRDAENNKDR